MVGRMVYLVVFFDGSRDGKSIFSLGGDMSKKSYYRSLQSNLTKLLTIEWAPNMLQIELLIYTEVRIWESESSV